MGKVKGRNYTEKAVPGVAEEKGRSLGKVLEQDWRQGVDPKKGTGFREVQRAVGV